MSQEDKRFKILIVLLLVLLLTNWLTWTTASKMQAKVNNLEGNLNNLTSRVSADIVGIRGVVDQMKEDARWWTPAEVKFLNVNEDTAKVKISWSLREYRDGSQVTLNYQKPGEQKYTQVSAEEESKGRFSTVLEVAVPQEPIINLNVQMQANNSDSKPARAVQETVGSSTTGPELTYYISMQDGSIIRTSEKQMLPLMKLSYNFFSPVYADIRLLEDGKIVASAHTDLVGKTRYEIKEIYLESREGNNAVAGKWSLQRVNNQEQGIYQLNTSSKKDIKSLYLIIEYQGGHKAERKII